MFIKLLNFLRQFFGVDKDSALSDFVQKQEEILNILFDKVGIDVNPDVFISDFYPSVLLNPEYKHFSDENVRTLLAMNLFEYLQRIEFEPMAPYTQYSRLYLMYAQFNLDAGVILKDRTVKDLALKYALGLVEDIGPVDYIDAQLKVKGAKLNGFVTENKRVIEW